MSPRQSGAPVLRFDDYIDVAARIKTFYERHPDGRLTGEFRGVQDIGDKNFVVYAAKAYRTADDPLPGVGHAWEPFPGPTSFTKDSELQNAETAAWGRAIVAVGIVANKIASKQEVQNRSGASVTPSPDKTRQDRDQHRDQRINALKEATGATEVRLISEAQRKLVHERANAKKMQPSELKALIDAHTGQATTKGIPLDKLDAVLEEIGS